MSIPLLHKDRGFAVIAVPNGFLVYRRLAFGIAAAPLLWGRAAALYCRLAQSMCESWEARFRAYVDDPLVTLAAPTSRASYLGGLVLLLWCSLGLSLSWEKGSFGRQVQINCAMDWHVTPILPGSGRFPSSQSGPCRQEAPRDADSAGLLTSGSGHGGPGRCSKICGPTQLGLRHIQIVEGV
eukprot:2927859-Amphidinium_carterae.1